MMMIPDAALADLHARFGHALQEYDGLAEAIYAHEQSETWKAALGSERPLFRSGVMMSSPTRSWGAVDRFEFGVLFRKPANCG